MVARLALPVMVALAVACGGGRGTTRQSAPPQTAGPADIPAMLALLERYSPTGHYIVSTYATLPRHFVFGDTTIDVTHTGGFADYFPSGAPEDLADNMRTAVHEVYHAYASLMAYQLLIETRTARSDGAEAVYLDQRPMLVTWGVTYPARAMDATFPADARTSRYSTYVSPSQDSQSTQQQGAYALLDEMTAYYHGARTLVDLWPWVRDEAPAREQLLVNYIARFHEIWVPHAEFRLFILHYLWHARTHRPDVYRAMMANQGFRRAFAACDDAYVALLLEAGRLEPTIHAFARGRGVNADLEGGQLTFDGSPFTIRDDAYPSVLRHLASPRYREILADLR